MLEVNTAMDLSIPSREEEEEIPLVACLRTSRPRTELKSRSPNSGVQSTNE